MNKLFTVAAVAAAILATPAMAQSAKGRYADVPDYITRAPASAQHAYGMSKEAGDYKFCLKTDSSPGCMYQTWQQCEEDRAGRGGFCFSR